MGAMSTVRTHDFRRSELLDRTHVHALERFTETFARSAGTSLSTALRVPVRVAQNNLRAMTWGEYGANAPETSLVVTFSLPPLPGTAVLQLPLEAAMLMVDLRLGGSASRSAPSRPLTEIDQVLLRPVLETLLAQLREVFSRVLRVTSRIVQLESSLEFTQIAAPNDLCVTTWFDLGVRDQQPGQMVLCIPLATLRPLIEAMQVFPDGSNGPGTNDEELRMVRAAALDLPLPIRVRFPPVKLTPAEILGLTPGDIVHLSHPAGAPLQLLAGGVTFASARQGRRGKRLACQIIEILNRTELSR